MNKNFVKLLLGEQKLNCFDAGASYFLTDNWVILLNSLAAKLYLSDPNSESLNYIPEEFRDYVNIIPYGVGNKEGPRNLYVANEITGTSLYPPCEDKLGRDKDHEYFYPLRVKEIKTKKLSTILDEYNEGRIDLMKLDTQGSEYEILQSMDSKRMNNLLAVEVEVQLKHPQIHKGTGYLWEIQRYLQNYGLEIWNLKAGGSERPKNKYQEFLFDKNETLEERDYCLNRITEVDVLFMRSYDNILKNNDKRFIRRYITLLCAFYFFTEAISFVDKTHIIELLGKSEVTEIMNLIKSWKDHHTIICKNGFSPLWYTDTFKDRWRHN